MYTIQATQFDTPHYISHIQLTTLKELKSCSWTTIPGACRKWMMRSGAERYLELLRLSKDDVKNFDRYYKIVEI